MSPPRSKESKDKTPEQSPQFHVVILHADGEFATESYTALADLVTRLKELTDSDVSVFAFSGVQLKISKPPFRHLLTPQGPQPLFDITADNLEPDDSGYLGVDATHLAEPPVIKSPDVSRALSPDADEFFDDDSGDNGLGVFDSVLPDPDN